MSETSELTGPLLRMIRETGIWATRLQCGRVRVRGGWMYLCPAGTTDILSLPDRGPTWLETKIPKTGKQTPDQVKFQEIVEGLGMRYVIVRTIDEGLEALR